MKNNIKPGMASLKAKTPSSPPRHRFNLRSMKRATILITCDGRQSIYQEDDGKVDEQLRVVIRKVRGILNSEYVYDVEPNDPKAI